MTEVISSAIGNKPPPKFVVGMLQKNSDACDANEVLARPVLASRLRT